ncbi:hypothetical protein BpHYR1_021030 [Brachionus plicatilis]|uniref:HTH psq-type domain-containing protein n=1 Tax=Brachionus plicatilis TaxID=10195 RepID=A0A3M7SGP6_BRAPC|nr:hypothetical protein BpHYR1_021030 [Brachionus plicatilis]
MNEKQVCKKRKCMSLKVKIEIIKKHTEQKITTSKLAKEYKVNATSTISTILSSKAKILEHYEKNLAGPEKKLVSKFNYKRPVEQESDAEIEEQQDANKQFF